MQTTATIRVNCPLSGLNKLFPDGVPLHGPLNPASGNDLYELDLTRIEDMVLEEAGRLYFAQIDNLGANLEIMVRINRVPLFPEEYLVFNPTTPDESPVPSTAPEPGC